MSGGKPTLGFITLPSATTPCPHRLFLPKAALSTMPRISIASSELWLKGMQGYRIFGGWASCGKPTMPKGIPPLSTGPKIPPEGSWIWKLFFKPFSVNPPPPLSAMSAADSSACDQRRCIGAPSRFMKRRAIFPSRFQMRLMPWSEPGIAFFWPRPWIQHSLGLPAFAY